MRRVLPEVPAEIVPIPEGVLAANVNLRTGLPTGPEDPEAITEFFIRGEVPTSEAEPDVTEPVPPLDTTPPSTPEPIAPAPLPAGAAQR
jgi:hypothetical protein